MQIEFVIKADDKASGPINRVNEALSGIDKVSGGAQSALASLAGGLAGIAQYAAGQLVAQGISAIASAVKGLADDMIDSNASFERYETQFSVLLGSSAAAQIRLEELADFGVKTPFELPGIVESSKILQSFGGDALATGDNLTLAGDMAAASGEPFQSLSLHFGRMYDALQSGRPFGESAMRLQELGLLTGPVRAKLEEMQATGVSGAEIWTYFAGVMGDKVGGMMDAQSATFEGMLSNVQDWLDQTKRAIGEPIFDVLKDALSNLLDFLGGPEMQGTIEGFIELMEASIGLAGDLLGGLDVGSAMKSMFAGIADSLQQAAWFVTRLRDELSGVSSGDIMGQLANQIEDRKNSMLDALNEMTSAHQDALSSLNSQITEANDTLASSMADIAAKAQEKIADVEQRFADTRAQISEQMAENIENFEEQKADRAERLQEQMTDLSESHAEKRAELVEALGEATTDKEREEIQKRIDKEDAAYNKRFAKLEADNAKQEEKAQRQHDKALSKLQERLDKEDAKRAEQVAKIQAEQAAEEAEVQKKHDQLLSSLQARIDSENAAYIEQSATLKAQSEADIADMTATAKQRAAELGTGPAAQFKGFVDGVVAGVQTMVDIVQPKIDAFKAFWDTELYPTLQTIAAWWKTDFQPKFQELADTVTNNLMPAMQDFNDTMDEIRMSVLMPLWGFFQAYILPILLELATFVIDVLIAAFKWLANTWTNVVKPALQAIWDFLSEYVFPILQSVANVVDAVLTVGLKIMAGVWQNILLPALRMVWDFVDKNILPIFREIARVVNDVLGPPLKWLHDNVVNPLASAFGNMGRNVDNIKQSLNNFADAIRNIQLPPWLTPGSPTPFELGLRGIQDAMQQLNGAGMPSFAVGGATAGASGGSGIQSVTVGSIAFHGQSAPTNKDEADKSAQLFLDAIKNQGQF